MTGMEPLSREQLTELEPLLKAVESVTGFVPNSLLTMARSPPLFRSFLELARTVMAPFGGGVLAPATRQLIAAVASTAAGCRYCQAHTSHAAEKAGAGEKAAAVWEFETSPLFTAAERAALRLARDAALVPNQTTGAHWTELRLHYSEAEILEIVAVISLFGFLNRWNDTLATRLEPGPRQFASRELAGSGWQVGKHV